MSDYLMSNESFIQPEASQPSSTPKVFLYTTNEAEGSELVNQMSYFGYNVNLFHRQDDLNRKLRVTTPKALIVMLENGNFDFKELQTISRMTSRQANPVSLLVIGKDDSISTRLKAVRAGAVAFFTYPVDAGALIGAVDEFSSLEASTPYRIMIVGGSVSQASYYAMQIERVGMETRIVTDIMSLAAALGEFNPDLVLMERLLPDYTGYELAQVIHQMDNFVSVPIVYLSGEIDEEHNIETKSMGGDYVLTKSVKPYHLVAVVTSRVKRYRKLRGMMINDSLTGLLNHTSTKERLDNEIIRASREKKSLAYVMIDLDNFKTINDLHGHGTGDRALQSIARMFKQRLRRTDLVGRNGGDEFGVIMPNTNAEEAAYVMEYLREGFSKLHHRTPETTFTLTFSCGVAAFPEFSTAETLTQAADSAMYQAKRRGRNRVIQALKRDESGVERTD